MTKQSAVAKTDAEILKEMRAALEEATVALSKAVELKMMAWLSVGDAGAFRAMEIEVAALTRDTGDSLVELVLRARLASGFEGVCSKAARQGSGGPMFSGGRRDVKVTLRGGRRVTVNVGYLKPDLSNKPGPRRGTGRRGVSGVGIYPVLAALGISFGVTPGLADEISRQVTDSDSVRAGRAALERRGIDLGHKQTLRIVNGFGKRAVEQRAEWLAEALKADLCSGPLQGKRVMVGIDGGRIRERVAKPGRRSAETGHHRYEAPWREPKLFTIYVIDDAGKATDTFRPVYDGTMGDCDAAFAMLTGYLKAMGAHEAKELVFLGDGARWIWDRIDPLVAAIGIESARVSQVVDWFHAVETLEEVADAWAKWPEGERARWLKRAKDLLHAGSIDKLLGHFDLLAIGRRAAAVNKHRDYFASNDERMQYEAFVRRRLPIGSGAIESAIRRVVNMRLKGNGTFWRIENAEAMLMLRSYLKSGRFDDLVDWTNTSAAPWQGTAQPYNLVSESRS